MLDRRDVMRMLGLAAVMPLAPTRSRGDAGRPVNTLGSSDGVAIRGYDPVAYFRDGGPRPGKAEFSVRHGGAVWRFASAEHKALFEADPARYLPAYGGFCAYGTSRGYLVKIDPEAWSIVDGRLYLNYDRAVQKTWSAKTSVYINQADAKWPSLALQDNR
ncbi:YHS domain-containing (seleno)protein [Bosea sp. PAMC 26642]|uniref:YHS domain-containing (seleno)protein n=1 Tax=Bosea sp. (strain PAMC 26642) TaxID=1792307 RepID=UPI0007700AD9|nr:YHS domain-containing (seleno)protein [Bosea sp. PAMC 26642]AMJ60400.1 hypothetical protein AXW83_08930 [Bosea sp. PAMC 26642]